MSIAGVAIWSTTIFAVRNLLKILFAYKGKLGIMYRICNVSSQHVSSKAKIGRSLENSLEKKEREFLILCGFGFSVLVQNLVWYHSK